MKVKCHRCSHEWEFKGKSLEDKWKNTVCCPRCRTTITVEKNPTNIVNKFIKRVRG